MLSMTGYGYAEAKEENIEIVVEIKSVNNRYSDINIKMPYFLNPYEKKIRTMILQKAQRGKIDVSIFIRDKNPDYNININLPLAQKYYRCFSEIIKELQLKDEIRLSYFLKADGVIEIDDKKDSEKLWNMLEKYLQLALSEFFLSRKNEGEETKRHIIECLEVIDEKLNIVKENSKDFVISYEEKIRKKVRDLIGDEIDENRILMEAGLLASKSDISEEIERLTAHLKQFRNMCIKDDAVGRQLDFISQEINRELNTIGSKANSILISQEVIDMKTELEKIKEQIRNVE